MAKTYAEQLRVQISQTEDQVFNLYQQTEHLEARLEGLKQALDLYLKTEEGMKSADQTLPLRPRVQVRRTKRHGSGFDEVMRFIRATGQAGATIEDMHKYAQDHGLKLKRTSIRSNVWNHKTNGALIAMGEGRYRATQSSAAAAESNESAKVLNGSTHVAAMPASDNITGRPVGIEPAR